MPYTGSYGATFLSGTSQLLALLAGSSWETRRPPDGNMVQAVDDAFAAWIFNAARMSSVRAQLRGLRLTLDIDTRDHNGRSRRAFLGVLPSAKRR